MVQKRDRGSPSLSRAACQTGRRVMRLNLASQWLAFGSFCRDQKLSHSRISSFAQVNLRARNRVCRFGRLRGAALFSLSESCDVGPGSSSALVDPFDPVAHGNSRARLQMRNAADVGRENHLRLVLCQRGQLALAQ